jgi:hypothetical protein
MLWAHVVGNSAVATCCCYMLLLHAVVTCCCYMLLLHAVLCCDAVGHAVLPTVTQVTLRCMNVAQKVCARPWVLCAAPQSPVSGHPVDASLPQLLLPPG